MNSSSRTRLLSPLFSAVRPLYISKRFQSAAADALRRSYLYVPASSDRMLDKSLTNSSDMLIYDLEDSVPPSRQDKESARQRLAAFLSTTSKDKLPRPGRVAVRVNDLSTPFFQGDIAELLKLPSISTVILPKIHSAQDLHHVSRTLSLAREGASESLKLVASIESARAMWNLGEISSWRSEYGPEKGGRLDSLLFASEDYCADTSVIRTTSRQELLFVRSQIVVAAKAHRLGAIDMVCINYKDLDYLKDECEDGRKLGFTGKQAIHPTQVDIIQSTFVPTAKDILRAAKVLHQMEISHSNQKGAFGLDMEGGGREMIDAPMLKQAENTIRLAKAAGLNIPNVSSQ